MKADMYDLQQLDLQNIAEHGVSYNLQNVAKYECFKNSTWVDVLPGQSLYQLALLDIPLRKKQMLKSL